jgi:hypothetical protein
MEAVDIISNNMVNLDDLILEFGDFNNFGDEIKKANENREIHRILLKW